MTAPSVPYKIRLKAEHVKKKVELEIIVSNPAEWPEKEILFNMNTLALPCLIYCAKHTEDHAVSATCVEAWPSVAGG